MKPFLSLSFCLILNLQSVFAQMERMGEALELYNSKDFTKAAEIMQGYAQIAPDHLPDPELASFYVLLGNAYFQSDQKELADLYYLRYRQTNQRLVLDLTDSAEVLSSKGQVDAAVIIMEAAIDRSTNHLGKTHETTLKVKERGVAVLEESNRLERAEAVSAEICQYYGGIGDLINFNKVSIDYARILEKAGNIEQSEKVYNHFLTNTPKYVANGNPHYIRIISDYAMSLHNRKKYVESIDPFLVMEMAAEVNVFTGENAAAIYNNLGLGLKYAERYEEALTRYQKALEIRQGILPKGHESLAQSHLNLGILLENMKDYERSVYHLGEALKIYEHTDKKADYDNAYQHFYPNLILFTKALEEQGNDGKMLEAYLSAIEMETELTRPLSHWFSISLSYITYRITHQDRLIDLEQLYLKLAKMYGKRFGEGSRSHIVTLIDLAQVYELSGRDDQARAIFSRAAESAAQKGKRDEGYAYATAHYAMHLANTGGDRTEAKNKLREAVGLYESLNLTKSRKDNYQSFFNAYAGILKPSDPEFQEVKTKLQSIPPDTTNRNTSALSVKRLNMLAIMSMSERKFAEAVKFNEKALKLARDVFDENDLFFRISLPELGYAYVLNGDFDKAIELFEEVRVSSFNYINKNRAFLSEDELGVLYQTISVDLDYYNFLVLNQYANDQDKVVSLFENAVFTKGLLFNNSQRIMQSVANGSDETLKRLVTRLRWKRNELINPTDSSASPSQLESEILQLEKEVSGRSNRLGQLFGQTKIDWNQIRNSLKPGEALVEIVRIRSPYEKDKSQSQYGIMILKSNTDSPVLEIIADGAGLEGKYLGFNRTMMKAEQVDTLSYKMYWAPIEKHLAGINRVFISPDGIYNMISLPALYDTEESTYLIDKYQLSIISNSADLIGRSEDKVVSNGRVELFGFPDYEYSKPSSDNPLRSRINLSLGDVTPIPGTLAEIEEINNILSSISSKSQLHQGGDASENAIKGLSSPGVLHIATHGFFQPTESSKPGFQSNSETQVHPLLKSGLLLSEGDGEDGILTGYEANNLDLNGTSLVVLSACETGLGDVRNGEGVYGLPRAFRSAGAESVVMSLWKVNDQATKDLMVSFYSNLFDNKTAGESLRAAQLAIREQYEHPYYWGAFVLTEGW